ncbi:beta-1,4-mannosyl-glycoprotein 4-beta-N-acetylglucosaminyltransferase-like isoform X2 [Scylla paramamosain]|uniref:beta-1,4-mannosyl-glycoprotein 4-beta-N-acetylglucosaminyltransferase-like isoform X2 n=1 Tax=Scylla paramamosain TaxID=85552 RepID=UPI0030828B06
MWFSLLWMMVWWTQKRLAHQYTSGPFQAINIRKRKLDDMKSKFQEVDKKAKISVIKVEQAKVGREENVARTEALASLKELQETQNKLQLEIQKYRDSDPEVLAQIKENTQEEPASNMVRLKVRCRCIVVVVVVAQIFVVLWFFSQPLDPPQQFLQRLSSEGGQSILHLKDQPAYYYYASFGKELCVREGTVVDESSETHCVCHTGWLGRRCGIPALLQSSPWIHDPEMINNLQLRRRVKRVILLLPLSHEFDIFEANVNGLRDLVDVFIIGERKLNSKASHPLLKKLKNGWLGDHQDKFIYVPARESYLMNSSHIQGIVHDGLRLLSDIRPDDLLILTSGEEIIARDVLVFLKLFQGYPLPIRCQFKHYIYGFFWRVENNRNGTNIPQICILSVKFFANAFQYQMSELQDGNISKESRDFLNTKDQPVQEWTIPEVGWKCHLCISAQNMFEKFINLPQGLRPKWFLDSPSSMLPFIQRLVKFGQDENLNPVGSANLPRKDTLPPFMWQNHDRFSYLMVNPYETMSIHNII